MPDESPAGIPERFAAALREVGGAARHLRSAEEAADAIAAAAAGAGCRRVLYAPFALAEELGLGPLLAGRGVELVEAGRAGEAVSRLPVALTGAEAAIAESGTLLLGGRPGAWGLVSALARVHLVLLRAQVIYPDLPAAFAAFARRLAAGEGEWVWVTGPSRTADIGHTLVHGAHGPTALEALILR